MFPFENPELDIFVPCCLLLAVYCKIINNYSYRHNSAFVVFKTKPKQGFPFIGIHLGNNVVAYFFVILCKLHEKY